MIVFGLGKNLLFKSVLGHCELLCDIAEGSSTAYQESFGNAICNHTQLMLSVHMSHEHPIWIAS